MVLQCPVPLLGMRFAEFPDMVTKELIISEPTAWGLFSTPGACCALAGQKSMGIDESWLQLQESGLEAGEGGGGTTTVSQEPYSPGFTNTQSAPSKSKQSLGHPSVPFWPCSPGSLSTRLWPFGGTLCGSCWSSQFNSPHIATDAYPYRCLLPPFRRCL